MAPKQQNRITLEMVKKCCSASIGATSLGRMTLEERDFLTLKIIDFVFDVISTKIADDTYTAYFNWEFPSSWWQCLKQDFFPKWFIKRYPVKYKKYKQKRTIKFTRMAEYPKANLQIPRQSNLFIHELGDHENIRDQVDYQVDTFNPTKE